ncbi:uncharacterized protein N7529_003475 [Penicillium soppii]|uniref:uncharacterized protein n=1 Tax=Penicillium soppii TaxID=69789 RepID=UPI002546D702|nr:uncharacterized protein N7529_003475 [Penicillium soppii]KAJ5871122.1 hypothetical protein N7529_003475 [Penicillium soppii]
MHATKLGYLVAKEWAPPKSRGACISSISTVRPSSGSITSTFLEHTNSSEIGRRKANSAVGQDKDADAIVDYWKSPLLAC